MPVDKAASPNKPDDVSQGAWDEAYGHALLYVQWLVPAPDEYVQAEYVLTQTIARAILAAEQREREATREDFIEWIRAWAKKRFGVWITHSTAKAAFASFLEFRNRGASK